MASTVANYENKTSLKRTVAILSVVTIPLFMAIFTSVIYGILSLTLDLETESNKSLSTFFQLLSTAAGCLISVYLHVVFIGIPNGFRKKFLSLKNFQVNEAFTGFLVGIGCFFILQVVSVLVTAIFGSGIESSDTSKGIASGSGPFFWMTILFLVPLLTPFVEELVFRGYLMSAFRNYLYKSTFTQFLSVVLPSVLFASLHYQGISGATSLLPVIVTFFFGLANGLLVLKFRSLYPAILSHIGYNGITVIVMILAKFYS